MIGRGKYSVERYENYLNIWCHYQNIDFADFSEQEKIILVYLICKKVFVKFLTNIYVQNSDLHGNYMWICLVTLQYKLWLSNRAWKKCSQGETKRLSSAWCK